MKYFIIACLLFLSGCSSLEIFKTPVERLPLNLSDPSPLKMEDVKFVVITKESAVAVFSEMEDNQQQPVLFGLTEGDYKSLSVDIEMIKNYLILQKEITKKYREYYEPTK